MPKKVKKSKNAEQKARVAAKQSKRATQKSKKAKSKGTTGSDAEDVDLDSVLEEYVRKQALYLTVTEDRSERPSSRSSATLIASPSKGNELLLFGGEYFNGTLANFYNDLYIYVIDKDEWRIVTSPNSPLPRSGHAWCRSIAGGLYLFGGEFSSPKQGTFHHYNDFWHLDPSTREWDRLESKGKSPPARSGHRMTYYKNYIILFGGFQDTSQQTRYLQDLWIYDCTNYIWHSPVLSTASQRPDARSSFSFLPHENGAVLYGGYSRVKASAISGKQNKGGGNSVKNVLKPMVHTDTWLLRISLPPSETSRSEPPQVRWERRKKPANPPNPTRAGVSMAYHKGRGILFGGVHDTEESEEGIESEFFNTLFAWNIDRNRFFPLNLHKPRTGAKKQVAESGGSRRARGRADEEDLLRNLAALEAHGTVAKANEVQMATEDDPEDKPTTMPVSKPVQYTFPHARFNAQLAIQEDILYIFGGTYEHKDREYTFNELHAIHLGRLDGVKEIYREEFDAWQESEDESTDSDEEDEDADDAMLSDDDDDEESGGVALSTTAPSDITSEPAPSMTETDFDDTRMDVDQPEDDQPQPRPFEPLRDYFARTSTEWQEYLIRRNKDDSMGHSVKELRAKAFDLAESKWWDAREEITAIELEQEEAGIGEVVNLADRQEAGASGRRR